MKSLSRFLLATWTAIALFVTAPPSRATDEHSLPEEETVSGPVDLGAYVPGAQALEGRIIAPCCFTQTLDVHGSPLAIALRKRIRAELTAGKSADEIERGLVAEYGPRVLAEPPQGPLRGVGIVLTLTVGLLGVLGGVLLLRFRRAGAASSNASSNASAGTGESRPATPAQSSELKARLDARLDQELAELKRDSLG